MPQSTLLSLSPGTHGSGELSCVPWDTVRQCLQQESQGDGSGTALVLPGHICPPPPVLLTRTSLPIHVCVGFTREDTVFVGDCVQRLGDVQEGVAAVNNPRHFLRTGSEFVIYQLRE